MTTAPSVVSNGSLKIMLRVLRRFFALTARWARCETGTLGDCSQSTTKGGRMSTGETQSINDIRTAIRELSARAALARREGRPDAAAEIEQRIDGYREKLGSKP